MVPQLYPGKFGNSSTTPPIPPQSSIAATQSLLLLPWVIKFSFSVGTFAGKLWDLLEQREDRAGTAIYTAKCGHAFHFPCIAAHVRSHDSLVSASTHLCAGVSPVFNCTWKDVPLLAIHKNLNQSQNDVVEPTKPKPREVDKKIIVEASSPRASSKTLYDDDESLFSPTSRIIPIPKVDDEDEDATDPFPETTTSRSSRAMSFLDPEYNVLLDEEFLYYWNFGVFYPLRYLVEL
ncbi:hypothetical protein GBA52_026451 [Prunus armeniaca]|nr:hypothetical protein GBA52_026451 [Prunus armeniaca]